MVINVRTKVKILLKLKKLSLFLIFFIFGYLSYSQVKISGVVLDVKLKPLPGVNVYLKDTYDGATTDDLGKFEFETIEVGQQNLVASYLGFENYEKGIELASSVKDLKIILKEKIKTRYFWKASRFQMKLGTRRRCMICLKKCSRFVPMCKKSSKNCAAPK